MSKKFDTVVIGGGPGGYVAAIRCSQLGQKVALIEKENLGGICLNWGCIPTKALLRSAEAYKTIQEAEHFGLKVEGCSFDFDKIINRSRDISSKLKNGVGFLMKKNKIEVINGHAKFVDAKHIDVDGEIVEFNNAIIATGARARQIPNVLEADGDYIWTYRNALKPNRLPKSLLVIGSGAIGIEFASFYNTFGVDVTVCDISKNIMPAEDIEISTIVKKQMESYGVNFITSAILKDLKVVNNQVTVNINGENKTYENCLLSIGIVGNVENLGLENVGVQTENGFIKVSGYYQTSANNIFAIGDVIKTPALAHVASHEGVIVSEFINGEKPHKMDYSSIPGCTYCNPQVGSVGLSEEAALAQGFDIKVGRFNYGANGKAIAVGEDHGLVKTIFDKNTGELLGAHIVGHEATEMISTMLVAKGLQTTDKAFSEICLPHPTLSEMLGEAVLDSNGVALNS